MNIKKQDMVIPQSRRERLREATLEEIKSVAWQQMAEQGAAAISLRAIASQMGMSAPALYNYYKSRDELVTALIVDAYNSLAEATHGASQNHPAPDYGLAFLAACLAFREWGLSHRAQFILIYGTPIPGYQAPSEITTPPAIHATAPFTQTLENAWRAGQIKIPAEYIGLTSATHQHIQNLHKNRGSDLPAELHQITITGWGTIHGLVSLELYGHFDYLGGDMGDIYRAACIVYLKRLGMLPADYS